MPVRFRPAPLFGALIAAAGALYASRAAARPPPRQAASRPAPGWAGILANTWAELGRDHIPSMAAGVAFYAFLSIFPGMSAAISLYGLAADPGIIEKEVSGLSGVLPQAGLQLMADQLHALIAAPPGKLGLGLAVSLLATLWSAMSGTGALMQALAVAYEEEASEGIIAFYGRAVVLTIGIGVFGLASLFLIAVVPAIIDLLPMPAGWRDIVPSLRWPVLAGLVFVALGILYRFAPARQSPHWHWLSAGTIGAAVLWLAASAGFSFYVARFASYDKTYGSLGAVVVLLMWFYVSSYIVLAGAELNCEIERARRR
jgi:membrane protein